VQISGSSFIGCAAAVAATLYSGPLLAQDAAIGSSGPTQGSGQTAVVSLPPPPDIPPVTEAAFARPDAGGPARLSSAEGRKLYLGALTREAEQRGLPPALADAVATIESGYRTGAVGTVGEVGLMQVRPSTAAMLGYRGSLTGLFSPEVNIQYGVTYLAEAWRIAGGQLCETLMKYRAGHGETRMTQRSVEYCARARQHLASIGSPLARAPVPQAVAETVPRPPRAARAAPGAPAQRVAGLPQARPPIRRAAWAAHDARFKAIQSKVSDATLRIMQ
jgi:hypothetical protein